MDGAYEVFVAAQREFGVRVDAVGDQQWDAPTPCAEWTVAELVRHLIAENRYAAPLVHGQDLEAARLVVEGARTFPVDGGVGANVAAEWGVAAVGAADAFADAGALDRTVQLVRGPAPAREYLAELTLDHVVHAWDLAQAIGYDAAFPEHLVSAVAPGADQAVGPYGTMFDPPVPVPGDAPAIDKLVAGTGRDPNWSAP